MATEVRLPQLSACDRTAHLVKWLKRDGEYVQSGEPLLEIQEDKAIIVIDSPATGYLRHLACENEEIPAGGIFACLFDSPNERCPLL